MSIVSVHCAEGEPPRVVADRLRLPVVLLLPVYLALWRLWGLLAGWIVMVCAAIALAALGVLAPWAAALAAAAIHLGLASDAPDRLRRRLESDGRPILALVDLDQHALRMEASPIPPPPPRRPRGPRQVDRDVIGLFPTPTGGGA